jgi:hypothetical protein
MMWRATLLTARGTAALAGACVVCGIVMASPAHAVACDVPLNGRYTAKSDGEWAKTRDSFHDEATVIATWTTTTSCTDALDCTGQVSSDQGWSAAAKCQSGMWTVTHEVPGWEPCADGTAVTGEQKFIFWTLNDPARFSGWDKTVGPSGGCGINQWQTVKMPFTLTKIE